MSCCCEEVEEGGGQLVLADTAVVPSRTGAKMTRAEKMMRDMEDLLKQQALEIKKLKETQEEAEKKISSLAAAKAVVGTALQLPISM